MEGILLSLPENNVGVKLAIAPTGRVPSIEAAKFVQTGSCCLHFTRLILFWTCLSLKRDEPLDVGFMLYV